MSVVLLIFDLCVPVSFTIVQILVLTIKRALKCKITLLFYLN